MKQSTFACLIFAAVAYFGVNVAVAQAQQVERTPPVAQTPPNIGGRLVARTIDLIPIPSRISHGVVSVRNTGTSASLPSVVTVNCHRPGQQGGCADIPAQYLAQYTDPAYPNRLVVQVPAIQPGHVYNHTLPWFEDAAWTSGQIYIFDFVADAGATNNESNEANNTGTYAWTAP
jgi:hypothetical protein